MNEDKRKHIRVEVAMTTEQQQQRSDDALRDKLVQSMDSSLDCVQKKTSPFVFFDNF